MSKPSSETMASLIKKLAYSHGVHEVFCDFIEAAAISISNAVDIPRREAREARYMQIVKRYTPEEVNCFPELLGMLTMQLEEGGPADVLGRLFHELELHNKYAGQFFTPYEICRMMAKMTMGDKATLEAQIAATKFITVSEPACGSGAMVIAFAQAMKDEGINYQQHLHVTAVDCDLKVCHMCYLQLSLLHVPAVVIRANTLSAFPFGEKPEDRWYTPAHVWGNWDWRLKMRFDTEGYRSYLDECRKTNSVGLNCNDWEKANRPPIPGAADLEYQTRLAADQVTTEFATKSARRLDAGKRPIAESPLFGGDAQFPLFE
jgi:hypothetical protein